MIERTYRQSDSNSYSFGTGTTSLYDIRLWSNNNYNEADLILPDGGGSTTFGPRREPATPKPSIGRPTCRSLLRLEISWDAARRDSI